MSKIKRNILKKIDLLKKIEEAKINQKAGNVTAANKTFQKLLKSNGDSFDVLFAYGLFCRDLKQFNLAKRVFLNLINNFKSSSFSHLIECHTTPNVIKGDVVSYFIFSKASRQTSNFVDLYLCCHSDNFGSFIPAI